MTLREYSQRVEGYNERMKLKQAEILMLYSIYQNTWYVQGRKGKAKGIGTFIKPHENKEPLTDPDNLLENAYKMWNRPKLEKNG